MTEARRDGRAWTNDPSSPTRFDNANQLLTPCPDHDVLVDRAPSRN
jgi:hypothetical protein